MTSNRQRFSIAPAEAPPKTSAVALARRRGIPVNVVDNLESSDFITPVIVDCDPVTVAIATERTAPVVRDSGFDQDDWTAGYAQWNVARTPEDLPDGASIEVANDAEADEFLPALDRIAMTRIAFPTHLDGRGFSLARHLRLLGYRGRHRASGKIVVDHYAIVRCSGFDEVGISASLAKRQPEEQWLFRLNWL